MDFYVECCKKLQNIEVALFLFSLLRFFMGGLNVSTWLKQIFQG